LPATSAYKQEKYNWFVMVVNGTISISHLQAQISIFHYRLYNKLTEMEQGSYGFKSWNLRPLIFSGFHRLIVFPGPDSIGLNTFDFRISAISLIPHSYTFFKQVNYS
jgi:hypothetical protein